MRPKLHPARQPRGKAWLYCRLCDVELRKTDRLLHEEEELHARLASAVEREDLLDRLIPYQCPGRVYFHYPGAAMLDNLLYDSVAAALGRRMDRGVSPAARPGR